MKLLEIIEKCSEVNQQKSVIIPSFRPRVDRDWFVNFFGFPDRDRSPDRYSYNKETGILTLRKKQYHPGWMIFPTVDEIVETVNYLIDNQQLPDGQLSVEIIENQDVGRYCYLSPSGTVFQGASQFNGLEMANPYFTPQDGIEIYYHDNTQGPRMALSALPGTFVRNYWIPEQLGEQFNGLKDLGLEHHNGYLLWQDDPAPVLEKINQGKGKIRIPAMIYTQAAGIFKYESGAQRFETDKYLHQIYCSSAPYNCYGNKGPENLQQQICYQLLEQAYIGTIGLWLILSYIDQKTEPLNLTLLGAGAFGNPLPLVLSALKSALNKFKVNGTINLHYFTSGDKDRIKLIKKTLGL